MKDFRYSTGMYDMQYGAHERMYARTVGSLNRVLGGWRPRRVLEAACGSGMGLAALHGLEWGCEYFAFDLDPEFVEVTRRVAASHGMEVEAWVGDLLDPFCGRPEYEGSMDLVVFRGNTLGHIPPGRYRELFANFFAMLAPGGRIIFDFRDGERYFKDRFPIEPLGAGYSKEAGSLFISWYLRRWPRSINEAYAVAGVVLLIGKRLKIDRKLKLEGHFHVPLTVLQACRDAGFIEIREITEDVGASLRFLRTFVAEKPN